jgi:TIR domain-containing protein
MTHFYDIKHSAVGGLVWYDARDIKIGEPNWRRKIESAIRECSAVIVVCSPHSKDSDAVASEIELAQSYEKPIYPVWVEGEAWGRSAPFSLMTYNYIDFRDKSPDSQRLVECIVDEVQAKWPPFFVAQPADKEFSNISAYYYQIDFEDRRLYIGRLRSRRFLEFVQVVYDQLLKHRAEPFSYGSQWSLSISGFYILPAKWAWNPQQPILDIDFYDHELRSLGITGSCKVVMLPPKLTPRNTIGLVIDKSMQDALFYLGIDGKRNYVATLELVKSVTPEELAQSDLSHKVQFCFDNWSALNEDSCAGGVVEAGDRKKEMGPFAWLRKEPVEEPAPVLADFPGGVYVSTVRRTKLPREY